MAPQQIKTSPWSRLRDLLSGRTEQREERTCAAVALLIQEFKIMGDQQQELDNDLQALQTEVNNEAERAQQLQTQLQNHPAAADLGPEIALVKSITARLSTIAAPAVPSTSSQTGSPTTPASSATPTAPAPDPAPTQTDPSGPPTDTASHQPQSPASGDVAPTPVPPFPPAVAGDSSAPVPAPTTTI
ncbi:MAG: hypothetical protein M3Y56_07935 [Armatimonadota bacterium]|nr:hypothetical protein [Armatimonadota bacterium]